MNRAWIELDRDALARNIGQFQNLLPRGCGIMAVVKADAYGHGACAVALALEEMGIRRFAVAALDEAVRLRDAGVKGEILILGYSDPACVRQIAERGLTQTVTCVQHGRALEAEARRAGVRPRVHLAVDTGMHRIGILPGELEVMESFYRGDALEVAGIFSHMCAADMGEEEHMDFSRGQAARFRQVTEALEKRGLRLGTIHLLSSYAAVNYPEYAFHCVRLGILMFGARSASSSYLREDIRLAPVMTLKARVTSVREIGPGESVSYGRTFRAERPTAVASVSIGYADGIPRCLGGGKLRAIVRGEYAQGIGRVCMDQLMLDVTEIKDVQPGDEVILIGRDGEKAIFAEELAEKAGTITNEIFSRLGSRLEGRTFGPTQSQQQ